MVIFLVYVLFQFVVYVSHFNSITNYQKKKKNLVSKKFKNLGVKNFEAQKRKGHVLYNFNCAQCVYTLNTGNLVLYEIRTIDLNSLIFWRFANNNPIFQLFLIQTLRDNFFE